jgi:dephospho-CoA kinase
MPSKTAPLVGVTGSIGSGKSSVCREFEALGRTVIAADRIARELTERDPRVREAIRKKFGDPIYAPDGPLRRQALAAIVFADAAKRRALNAIVHPPVFEAIEAAITALPAPSRSPYVIIEAALIFESGMDKRLAATVVVRADDEVRIARVMRRDGLEREDVLARMKAQMSADAKAQRADFVIDNNRGEEELAPKVAFIDRILTHMFPAAQGESVR